MAQQKVKILGQKIISNNYFLCTLEAPSVAFQAVPGQFINVRISDAYEPLLRRPLSIHRVTSSHIEIFYEVLGQGTKILSRKRQGEYLDIIGPLGNGFKLDKQEGSQAIIVSGGMGVAPLLFLAEEIVTSQKSKVTSKPIVLIGAKTKSQIICESNFRKLGCDVKIATDDGSRGLKGYVSALLENILRTTPACRTGRDDSRRTTVYACGPKPMLKAIAGISLKYNMLAQVSLEEHMACGIGACLGCVIRTKDGYRRVCVDGPVFEANHIIWRD